MQKFNHNFKKHFGQNFITNVNVILEVINLLELKSNDVILEIGPGDGRFTEAILDITDQITLVEIDPDLINFLSLKFQDFKNIKIIYSDILDFDLSEFKDKKYKVFGALPYNVSKKIIAKFLETEYQPERMVFVTQKEVAEDYTSLPPKASFLSNYARLFSKVEYFGQIDKHYFEPIPKVHGGVLRFFPVDNGIESNRDLAKFVKTGFRNPRKKLTNSLRTIFKDTNWEEKLIESNLNPNVRAAELTTEDWIRLYKTVNN